MYDLNIMWSPSTTQDQLLQTLTLASTLGYTTVALNHTLTLPFPNAPVAPFPSVAALSASSPTPKKLPKILYRATLPLDDPAASNYRLPSLNSAYDLLAVRPLSEKAFQNACLTLDIPIISLDFTQHFQFHFRPKPCMAAVTRGVRFEVCYSQALAADPRGRATFIGNVTSLVRATCGRGIILSSEAKNALSLRAPADVVNLLNVWGLPSEKGMQAFGALARSVVVNEGIKRSGFRGVVDVVETAKREDQDGADGPKNGQDGQGGKKNKNKGQNQNQKRKPGEEDSQQISKRQAKKMKLASRQAAQEKK